MTHQDRARLLRLLERHEGRQAFPYRCPAGRLTIGVGRNLEDVGLRPSEIDLLLVNDATAAEQDVVTTWPWTAHLTPARLAMLIDFRFNLGPSRFRRFAPTLALIERGDYAGAAARLRRSPWYRQTGTRATRLLEMLVSGDWPADVP